MKKYVSLLKRRYSETGICIESKILLFFFILMLMGVFFGRYAASQYFYVHLTEHRGIDLALYELIALPIILFLSTSYLGIIFVPLFLILDAFAFAASVSSIYVYSGGDFLSVILYAALPELIILPALILFSERATVYSGELLSLRYGLNHNFGPRVSIRILIIGLLFVLLEFTYCVYIIPKGAFLLL